MTTFSTEFWAATGVAIVTLILGLGVAVGMDTRTKGEYVFVVACFCICWLAIVVTVGLWYFDATSPSFQRLLVSGLFVAAATVGALASLNWATDRHTRVMLAETGPQTTSSPVPSVSPVPTVPLPQSKRDSVKPSSPSKVASKNGATASLEMEITPTVDLAGGKLYVDLNFVNVGQLTARRVVRLQRGAVASGFQSKEEVDKLWDEFQGWNEKEPLGVNDIGIKQKGSWRYEYADLFKHPADPRLLKAIDDGSSVLYIFIVIKYNDDVHPLLQSTACVAYTKGSTITCQGHNTMPL